MGTRKPFRGEDEAPDREATTGSTREERAKSTRIQDEPESTIGRKPAEIEHPERPEHGRYRSSGVRHE
jgi:hypothetical protein